MRTIWRLESDSQGVEWREIMTEEDLIIYQQYCGGSIEKFQLLPVEGTPDVLCFYCDGTGRWKDNTRCPACNATGVRP
jgi:hypothetical protein